MEAEAAEKRADTEAAEKRLEAEAAEDTFDTAIDSSDEEGIVIVDGRYHLVADVYGGRHDDQGDDVPWPLHILMSLSCCPTRRSTQ